MPLAFALGFFPPSIKFCFCSTFTPVENIYKIYKDCRYKVLLSKIRPFPRLARLYGTLLELGFFSFSHEKPFRSFTRIENLKMAPSGDSGHYRYLSLHAWRYYLNNTSMIQVRTGSVALYSPLPIPVSVFMRGCLA
jgi:hypothetical protein